MGITKKYKSSGLNLTAWYNEAVKEFENVSKTVNLLNALKKEAILKKILKN